MTNICTHSPFHTCGLCDTTGRTVYAAHYTVPGHPQASVSVPEHPRDLSRLELEVAQMRAEIRHLTKLFEQLTVGIVD